MSTASRLKAGVLAVLAIALLLAGCSGAAPSTVPPGPPASSAQPASLPPLKPPGMQLPARTSIGTGAQAKLWARGILRSLGAPLSTANAASMLAWFGAEDDHRAAGQHTYGAGENNPLNLTAYSANSVGVVGTEPSGAGPGHPGNLDFSTPERGVSATVWVIEVKYPAIYHALTSGRGLLKNPAVSAALSEWSGNGYSQLG